MRQLKIDVTGMTEDEVASAAALLEEKGFEYDEDYEALYAGQWEVVGIRFTSPNAAALVIERYTTISLEA